MLIELLNSVLMIVWYILAHSRMKLCLFASYTYKRKSIRVFRTPILVYLDVRGVEIPLLSTVSISNCRYQEAPGEVVWPGSTLRILDHPPRGLLSKNAKDALDFYEMFTNS